MKHTKFKDRILPFYTRTEEKFNMISHIVGGGFAIAATAISIIYSVFFADVWAVVCSAIYGGSLIILYTCSSVYHGLYLSDGKKVMQVIDRCAIYFVIGGTYTPIALCAIRKISPTWGWAIFGLVWWIAAIAITFTAIDINRFSKVSGICNIASILCILAAIKPTLSTLTLPGFLLLMAGAIFYIGGIVMHKIGEKRKYFHSLFHLFIIAGSILQFFAIIIYVL
ncbi:MAG: hemolysin III family protein [Clostridiales bacterium]|nr:hemolysin III family protein [Candidatus Equinaster intestinalis]